MYLKCNTRRKDGKEHRNWSVVESCRRGRKIARRHVLYLGELNDSQQAGWERTLEVFDPRSGQSRQMALFPAGRPAPAHADPEATRGSVEAGGGLRGMGVPAHVF